MADQLTPTETTVLPQVRDWLSRPRQLFIGGRWVDTVSGETFETIDPARARSSPPWPRRLPSTPTWR